MIRISIPFFYRLGIALEDIHTIKTGELLEKAYRKLITAERILEGLLEDKNLGHAMRSSVRPGRVLLQSLKKLTGQDMKKTLDFMDLHSITGRAKEFVTVFTAELEVADTYFVTKKRGYDTLDLIANAEVLLPEKFAQKVPEAIKDIREAGRCIAFDLGTAAGFHILRANEIVLKKYYAAVTNGAALPKSRNIGAYIREMEKLDVGDAKILSALTQMKDLHRNALMHPEDTLTVDEGIGLLGIAQSTIIAMLPALEAVTVPSGDLANSGAAEAEPS